jgi:hydrogenase maturation protease
MRNGDPQLRPLHFLLCPFPQAAKNMNKIIVVGIGNPYRGDDGAGWAVIQQLEKRIDPRHLRKSQGDIGELLEIFASTRFVYIVDACLATQVSLWRRIDGLKEVFPPERQTSTHGLTLGQTIDLAKALHQLPEQLIIYAIAGKKFLMQNTLSSSVAQAVDEAAQKIAEEMQACTKNMSSTI